MCEAHRLSIVNRKIYSRNWRRDYWRQVGITKEAPSNTHLKQQQKNVANSVISTAIINANTGIEAIDTALKAFYETGYLHNHVRMHIVAMVCNIGQFHDAVRI